MSVCLSVPLGAVFKALAHWADAFFKLKCLCVFLFVRVCVCLSVCSLLRYYLNVFFPPLPKVGCPKFLEIWNPWRKEMERSGLRRLYNKDQEVISRTFLVLVLLSASVKRCFVSRMRDFFSALWQYEL